MTQALDNLTVLQDGTFLKNMRPTSMKDVVKVTTPLTAVYINVPTGAKKCVFGATGNFAVRYNATQAGTSAAQIADTRTGNNGSGDGVEINPAGAYLIGVTELSFDATVANTFISITWYV